MSITQAMCTQFKRDVMLGVHDLDTHTIKIALYTSSASLDASSKLGFAWLFMIFER